MQDFNHMRSHLQNAIRQVLFEKVPHLIHPLERPGGTTLNIDSIADRMSAAAMAVLNMANESGACEPRNLASPAQEPIKASE